MFFLLRGKTVIKLKLNVQTVWPDCCIIFQSLAVYMIENLPSSIKIVKLGTNVCQIANQNHTKNFPDC